MVALARFFIWRDALVIVKPETFVKWHRTAFRIFWRWKSRKRGRPALPMNLRKLVREMARDNATWGEERIADELTLKLDIFVAPRTVRKYMGKSDQPGGRRGQRWATFVRNHATAIVACDFFVSITVRFKILYVFVAIEIGSRRILHFNVTAHPTAEWTTQQFRETLAERLIGTIRRECLDYLIPINERHLRLILKEFVGHYNRGRPHSALGPGIPEPSQASAPTSVHRHPLPAGFRVASKPVLRLHHEYRLDKGQLSDGRTVCGVQGRLISGSLLFQVTLEEIQHAGVHLPSVHASDAMRLLRI
jgi:putative transposase